MFKLVLTMKRRSGLTLEQFMNYYHEHHLPNVFAILPPSTNGATLHRRNYILRDDPFNDLIGDGRINANPPFDVITEIEFDNRADAEESMRTFFDERYIDKIKEDEAHFIEPGSVNFYVVDVHENRLR
ncbi:EthD domain-containing protein [Pseudomaricurvus alcaniphilus]|uniref:EthD domain-containing protein n=1 Tax=Pseudomaricurvus alcaniphilus TaxID=1166482 RepID=UPI00140A1628|nr:EthD domain-containing protein [Pseudomaricurvus alcaniphilus]NHN36533.1 EthD domain-containing protein [Pseudomaricurvus alcaniphilus]